MAYVDTVQSLPLARNRGGRPVTEATRERRAAAASRNGQAGQVQDDEGEKHLPGAQVGPGQEGGARLMRNASGWAWDFAVQHAIGERKLRVRDSVRPKRLIPPLRVPLEPLSVDTTSSLEYLRQMCSKYEHLGLDELVGPELVTAADEAAEPDMYNGSAFRIVHHAHARVASSLLLYKGGELGNDLHVAVFAPKSNTIVRGMPLVRFIASSQALERFPTEILQLDTSSAMQSTDRFSRTPLIVRVHSTTHLFALIPDKTYAGDPKVQPVSIAHLASLPSSATDGRRHMNISWHPTDFGRVAVIDDQGGVWIWRVSNGGENEVQLVRPAQSVKRGSFYRISWGTRQETLVVLSAGEMVSIDLEDPSFHVTILLQLPTSTSFLGIDKTASERGANVTCVLSTEEVIWVDEENTGQSTLQWRHDMGHLSGLTIMPFPQATHECFILYSHSSPTILIFHVSSTPIRLLCRPYPVQLPIKHGVPREYALIDLQRNTDRPSDFRLLATTTDGSVSGISVMMGEDDEEEEPVGTRWQSMMRRIWDDGLDALADDGPKESLPEDGTEKRAAAKTVYDARWAFEAIFAEVEDQEGEGLSAQSLARCLRELDAPSEHMITGAELARDAAIAVTRQQDTTVRTHNLHPLYLSAGADAAEALAAIDQVDLARDLVPVSQYRIPRYLIDGHTAEAVNGTVEVHRLLTAAYLPDSDIADPQLRDAHTRDTRHIASLAADLALSMRIMSSDPLPTLIPDDPTIQSAVSPDDVLVQAAKLTLDDNTAPDVKLYYLKPTETFDRDETTSLPRPSIQTPTVQHLLSEWDVGTDPAEYNWKSWISPVDGERQPNAAGTAETQPQTRHIRPLPSPRGSPRPSQSQYSAPVFDPTASRASLGVPTIYSQPQIYKPTNAPQAIPYSLPTLPIRKGVPTIVSHTQRLASPRPSPPPSPNPAYTPGPGRATNVSPTIRRQAARSPETSLGALAMSPAASQQWAATQVERGPFGGRPVVGGDKKKKPKKRLGGF